MTRTSDEEMTRRKKVVMDSKLVLSGERFTVSNISQMFTIRRPPAQSLVSAMIKDNLIEKIDLPSGGKAYRVKQISIISKDWRKMYRERAGQ
jgi:hypothetical protein